MSENTGTVPAAALLGIENLVSGYGRIETLHGVSATVPTGGMTAVIGPNGSGKSTMLKAVAGLLPVWSGAVLLGGDDVAALPAHRRVTQGMCTVPQGRVVFPQLTVEENLRMSAYSVRSSALVDARIEEAYEFLPVLAERRGQWASNLSGGEQVLLSVAKVVMQKPRLLLIDEPSLGLSPKMTDFVYERLCALRDSGLTVLLVEQNVKKALQVADHVIVLVLGDVRYQGSPRDLEKTIDLGTLFLEGKLA